MKIKHHSFCHAVGRPVFRFELYDVQIGGGVVVQVELFAGSESIGFFNVSFSRVQHQPVLPIKPRDAYHAINKEDELYPSEDDLFIHWLLSAAG